MQMNTIERGAELFAYESRGRELKPQQYEVGAALDELAPATAIHMSRRTAKTESVLLWLFATMDAIPGLRIAFTMATTREAARAKFMADILPIMEDFAELRGDVHLLKGAGYERIEFNRSVFQVVAPSDKSFRSKEFDIIVIDEAGEAAPEFKDEVLPAALPTMDTSSIGMLILMGTAGHYRAGNLLWDALADPDASVVNHSSGDDIDVSQLADWDYAAAMLEQYHVGLRTGLTTLPRLKRNWALLTPDAFAREYLNLWGDASGDGGLFSQDVWANLFLTSELPTPPKRFALGVAATEDSASIVAAWREDGEGRLLLLDHRPGRAWLPLAARDLARKYRVPIVLDPRASQVMQDVKQRLEQLRPAPRLEVQDYEDVGAAHERIVQEIDRGTVRHFGQDELSTAFTRVKRQQMGAKWKFGRINDGDDITPAQAAILALRYYDATPRAAHGRIEAVAV
jgi:hypothetical protein